MKLIPLDDRVVIKQSEAEEKTAGGIILPDTAKEKPHIGKALRKVNFAGDAMIELAFESDFKPTRPLRETLRMSRDYVRKTLGF